MQRDRSSRPTDAELLWHSPTNALDRFFKVGVEMK